MKHTGHISYFIEPIRPEDGPRRRREQAAIQRIIRRFFGDDATISHHESGAPFIPGLDIFISVSHSRNYAAVAWSRISRFGIDIEERRGEQLKRVAPRFLTSEELECYSGDNLIKAWTLKEASFKALKGGPPDLRRYKLPTHTVEDVISVHPSDNTDDSTSLKIVFSGWENNELYLSIVGH